MKRNYSYFIIKPDGIRFLNDICKNIEENFDSIKYYSIENFDETITKLYHKHFLTRKPSFKQSLQSYLWGLKELFGNYGVLALVSDTDTKYDGFMQKVFNTKLEIRKQFVNNNLGIITNYGEGQKNRIRILFEDGHEKVPRIMSDLGNHRINDMNVIHCPDPNLEDTLGELKILFDSGVINDKNLLTEELLQKMKKYQTGRIQADMKDDGYVGVIGPDISGFIQNEIEIN